MWTGIDIGNYTIKVVQLKRSISGPWQLNGVARISRTIKFGDESNGGDRSAKRLSKILQSLPAGRSKCVLGVSGREVNLRVTKVPPLSQAGKLKKLMEFEVMQIAGKSGGDVYSDYCLLNVPTRGYPELPVLVGLAKNSLVNERIDSLKKAGGGLAEVTPNALALFQVLRANPMVNLAETIVLLDIGHENTEVVIQKDGHLLFARNITSGGKAFTEALAEQLKVEFEQAELLKIKEGVITASWDRDNQISLALISATSQLQSVVETSVSFARNTLKMDELTVDRILLSGGGARIKGLDNYLHSVLNKPVEFLQPFKNINMSLVDPATAQRLTEMPSDMTVALGLAMTPAAGDEEVISFLPPAAKKKKYFRRRVVPLIAAAVLLVLALVVVTSKASAVRKQEAEVLARLEQDGKQVGRTNRQFKDELAGKEKTMARYQLLRTELEAGTFYYQVLRSIQKLLPRGVWVSELALGQRYSQPNSFETFYEKRVVVIRGYLEDSDEATIRRFRKFVADLDNQSSYQGKATLKKLNNVAEDSTRGKKTFEVIVK